MASSLGSSAPARSAIQRLFWRARP
jgi:hypothetical protein